MIKGWNIECRSGKEKTFIYWNDSKIKVPNFFWDINILSGRLWDFIQKWLLNRCTFTFSNSSEYLDWLENCYECDKFDEKMLEDPDINTCNTLFKILEQQGYSEKDRPQNYRFKRNEFKKCLH